MRCEFYIDDITVTSFINIDIITLPLKASRKEQRSVIRFLWAKDLHKCHSLWDASMQYGDRYFTRPAIHVWCKKFAYG